VDGDFGSKFLPALAARSGWVGDSASTSRALLRRGTDWHTRVSSKHIKELHRLERRLREAGRLEYSVLDADKDCVAWVDQFLAIENSGWKGASGTSMGSHASDEDYFREITRAAHRHGRLQMMRLELNDTAIAMKCNFLALPGAFAFKIAYDERYRKYSPGLLLELFNMDCLARNSAGVEWMDSCADSGHSMVERIWPDRREIGSQFTAGRGLVSRALVLAAPRYRRFKAMVKVPENTPLSTEVSI
jgi:CelD/BcsL family acetyltransferase involved in cellulose biosynthesis